MKQKLLNLKSLLMLLMMTVSMGAWADEISTYNSLDELAAADIPNGTHVNVYIEGTAKSALIMRPDYTIYFTDKSRDFTLTTDIQYEPEWYQPGGMLTGTLKNVICERSGDFFQFKSPYKEHNIFEDLEFTPNYKSLNELSEAIGGIGIGSWVPVKLNENEIVEITDDAVLVKDGDNVFALTANSRPNWEVGGTLSGTWLAKYKGWDDELGAYSLQYAAKNSNPWADLDYTFVETYASLEELIKSGQESGPINVTINNVINYAWDDGAWWYVYVQSGNKQIYIMAPIPDSKPDWMPGGTLRATLTNVSWGYGGLEGETKDFWNNFTYTPPVVTEYESIADLLAANIQGAAVVTVKNINNQISKIKKQGNYSDVYLDDNKIFLAGNYDPARNWEVGGILTGKLENVIFATNEVEGTTLYLPDGDILEGLTYTAPGEVPTFGSLEDLMKSGLKLVYVNVTINDAINFSWDNNGVFLVSILCGDTEITLDAPIPEQELNWLPGGTVSGTLTHVFFSYHTLYGETEDFWKALTYKAPEVTLYESIADLLADKDNLGYLKTVSVKINDQISKIRDYGLGAYDVYLDDNRIYIDGNSDPDRNWVVGGTLTGTLENVTYVLDEDGIPMLYIFKGDIFKDLTYTAPAVGTISVSSVGYTTYFTDKEFVMPEGLEGYVVTPKDETSVTLTKAFDGGQTVPASTALLVKGKAGSYPCAGSNTGATFSGDNCLHGNLTAGTVAEVSGASKYYKLLNGSNGLGWYLGAQDGGVFTLGANKAYLALSETQAQNAKSLSLVFDDATAIENVNADAENARAFNLAGQRVKANHKGIVIVNGKKIVNK